MPVIQKQSPPITVASAPRLVDVNKQNDALVFIVTLRDVHFTCLTYLFLPQNGVFILF
jgi:hypothetical protein